VVTFTSDGLTNYGVTSDLKRCQGKTRSEANHLVESLDRLMRIALFEPDIPQNAGTIMRMAACMGIGVDLIEPCGFVFGDRRLRRAGMDYLARLDLNRHTSWETYRETRARGPSGRLVLLTTHADMVYTAFHFDAEDTLMVGRESGGVPEPVHRAADARLHVPMAPDNRSLNVAVAAAMVLGEALRQTGRFPERAE
jgi:tRNA (cytidine/uridine-2'-O-)-methyltransferase